MSLRRWSRWVSAGAVVVLVVALTGGSAGAASATLTVKPATVVDGQTVTVSGSGFLPQQGNVISGLPRIGDYEDCVTSGNVIACPTDALGETTVVVCDEAALPLLATAQPGNAGNFFDAITGYCDAPGGAPNAVVTANGDGTFTTSFTVNQQLATPSVDSIPCTTNCVVVAFTLELRPMGTNASGETVYGFVEIIYGTTSIVFVQGPLTPVTKGECKNGGWRNLAGDQGRSFRNQGQCVSFVVAHRR
jgi:hypothetical protein